MIRLEQITKAYVSGQTPAVRELSLDVAAGEFVVLVGESGCGKTTTLKMINRLIDPTAGTILVQDENIATLDPVWLRRRIGYVFQEIGLFPHMTVAENAGSVLKLQGWNAARIEGRVAEVLNLVGLTPAQYRSRYPAKLSGGQKQRVGLARALAASPRIMLMDEPLGALDPLTRSELQEQLRRLQRQLELTVVMVTHDMMEALLLADRIAVMEGGKIVALDTPRRLLADPGHAYAAALLEAPKGQAAWLAALMEREE